MGWPRMALRFRDERLESLWQASQQGRRLTWDTAFCVTFALPTALAGVKAFQVKETLWPKLVYPLLVSLYFLNVAFLRRSPAAYIRWRDAVLSGFKVAVALIICSVVMIEEPSADTWPQFIRFELLLFQKGLIAAIFAVTLLQPFLLHCAVQSCMVLLFLLFNPSTCTAFHARQPSNYGRYQQASACLAPCASAPSAQLSCLRLLTVQVVGWLDRKLLPSGSSKERACPLAGCGQVYCMHVQALLIIGTGFVLPTLAILAMEGRARRKWLLGRLEVSGAQPPPAQKRGRRAAWSLVYLANLSLGLALLWHWLGWLYARRVGAYSLRPAA